MSLGDLVRAAFTGKKQQSLLDEDQKADLKRSKASLESKFWDEEAERSYRRIRKRLLEDEQGELIFFNWLARLSRFERGLSWHDNFYIKKSEKVLIHAGLEGLLNFLRIEEAVISGYRRRFSKWDSYFEHPLEYFYRNIPDSRYRSDAFCSSFISLMDAEIRSMDDWRQFPGRLEKVAHVFLGIADYQRPEWEAALGNAHIVTEKGGMLEDYIEICRQAMRLLMPDEFSAWLYKGLEFSAERPNNALVYFSLDSVKAEKSLKEHMSGVELRDVMPILVHYSRAMSGRSYLIASSSGRPSNDGKAIYLPEMISGHGSREANFEAYKVMAAIQAAKPEFGTFSVDIGQIKDLVEEIRAVYQTEASGDSALGYFFSSFPHPWIARSIFEIIEGKRIVNMLSGAYRGIRKPLERVISKEFSDANGLLDDFSRSIYLGVRPAGQSVELMLATALPATESSSVLDSIKATATCYKLINTSECSPDKEHQLSQLLGDFKQGTGTSHAESEAAPAYDRHVYPQWSMIRQDYLSGWCKVIEYPLEVTELVPDKPSDLALPDFEMRFQMQRARHLLEDGDELDIDAAVSLIADRKAGSSVKPSIYRRRKKQPRSVSACFLLDVSNSVLQERNGRIVLEELLEATEGIAGVESEHKLAIFAYSGEFRNNVRFYVVKSFDEAFDRQRLYSLYKANHDGTYSGPALRHSISIMEGQENSKAMFFLTDSEHLAGSYKGEYANADVRKAFGEARDKGIMPFAISFGSKPVPELRQSYGESFIQVKHASEIPRKLPQIYARLLK